MPSKRCFWNRLRSEGSLGMTKRRTVNRMDGQYHQAGLADLQFVLWCGKLSIGGQIFFGVISAEVPHMPVKYGVIGCGAIGQRRHIPECIANPDSKLVALADPAPGRVAELGQK